MKEEELMYIIMLEEIVKNLMIIFINFLYYMYLKNVLSFLIIIKVLVVLIEVF